MEQSDPAREQTSWRSVESGASFCLRCPWNQRKQNGYTGEQNIQSNSIKSAWQQTGGAENMRTRALMDKSGQKMFWCY